MIAVGHSQLISVYLILSTGARYHELGAQYMQAKIERKRKVYLSSELKKLGYAVSLSKVPIDTALSWKLYSKGRLLLEHPQSENEIGLNS